MPDHFHAIVKIVHTESDNNIVGTGCDNVGNGLKPFPTVSQPGPK